MFSEANHDFLHEGSEILIRNPCNVNRPFPWGALLSGPLAGALLDCPKLLTRCAICHGCGISTWLYCCLGHCHNGGFCTSGHPLCLWPPLGLPMPPGALFASHVVTGRCWTLCSAPPLELMNKELCFKLLQIDSNCFKLLQTVLLQVVDSVVQKEVFSR